MAPVECPREGDVLMMVTTGRWPDRAPADLRIHAEACDVCADLARAAVAIDADREAAAPAGLPASGAVWWRAQLRARQEAARAVGRPITVARAALLAALGGVAGAVFGATTGWFQRALIDGWSALWEFAASVRVPSLPAPSAGAPSSLVAGYGLGLAIAAAGAALAVAVLIWALREE